MTTSHAPKTLAHAGAISVNSPHQQSALQNVGRTRVLITPSLHTSTLVTCPFLRSQALLDPQSYPPYSLAHIPPSAQSIPISKAAHSYSPTNLDDIASRVTFHAHPEQTWPCPKRRPTRRHALYPLLLLQPSLWRAEPM